MEQQHAQRQASGASASAWNAAGTFEERSMTDWAKGRVHELLPGTSSGAVAIISVDSITGDAHIWWGGGRLRAPRRASSSPSC